MELARRRPYATAGVALAAAGLIAVTPVAPPMLDLQERAVQLTALDPGTVLGEIPTALQTVFGVGLHDISLGAAALGAGEVPTSVTDFITAADNFVVAAPEDVLLGLADALAGQPLTPNDFFYFAPVTPAVDLAQLTTDLQEQIQAGVNDISTGLGELAQGTVNGGLAFELLGLDSFFVSVPEVLFQDSLGVLAATLDPGAVAAMVDPTDVSSALGGLAADLPTLLLSLIP